MKSKIICNYKVPSSSQVVDENNNYFLISSQTEICSRGGGASYVLEHIRMSSNLISKGFIKSLINNKDYEITSRNTRDFS